MSAWKTSPLVVGHRGGRGVGWPPENTLPAFERAQREGAGAIELDVRTSAGGDAVVFHDTALGRMTGGSDRRAVHAVTLRELATLDLGGGAGVPSLRDVLSWARGSHVAVNIELKYDVPRRVDLARAVARDIRFCGVDVLFSSFDPLLLAIAAAFAPEVPRALLAHEGNALWANGVLHAARPPLVEAVHLERTAVASCRERIGRFRRRGLRVGLWTVNDPVEARDFVAAGAASIVTDVPGEVACALRSGNASISAGNARD